MDDSRPENIDWLLALVGDADVPGRKIRPSRYSVTGYASTTKASKAQETESSLELDFLRLLEFDDRVERFVAQPFTIRWKDSNQKRRKYTPDVIVKYSFRAMREDPTLRTTIFEVKPRAVLAEKLPEFRPAFRAAIGWARERDCLFHIVTDQEIRTPYLKNITFLTRYRTRALQDERHLIAERQYLVRTTLYRLQRTTPRDLLSAITESPQQQAEILPWLWNLIVCKVIGIDLSQPLNMASTIWCVDTPTTLKALR